MRFANHPATTWILAAAAFVLAAAGARVQPGGTNDGSRLATSESLIDRGSLAIDDSVYVRPPHALIDALPLPHEPHLFYTLHDSTTDRVRVNGRFYSDKPMVPAALTAAAYRLLMAFGFPRPGDRPDVFCRVCTILNCGVGYAAAVGFMWRLGTRIGLSPAWRTAWLLSFALAGVLPAYTRNVNAGIPQLAAVAGLAVCLSRVAAADRTPWGVLLAAGTCLGFSYAVDPASGGLLVVAAVAAVGVRTRSVAAVAAVLAAAFPWFAAHHAINYAVCGLWKPVNMVPAYLDWPGSPFDTSNMTGLMRHAPTEFAVYLWFLLNGRTGFLLHNPPLYLAVVFGWKVLRRPGPDRVELAALATWSAAVVVMYALLSNNYGGGCLSVRWFVPLLVPGYWALARLLVAFPEYRPDFVVLTLGGLVLGVLSWPCGPWQSAPDPPADWVTGVTLGAWAVVRGALWWQGT